ncbi:hypothetical protein MC04F15_40680 [Escherichia coli]
MQPLTYQQTSEFIPTAVINRSQTKQAPGHEKIRDAVRAWSAVDRPLNRAQALAKIAEIKAKFGLKGASV